MFTQSNKHFCLALSNSSPVNHPFDFHSIIFSNLSHAPPASLTPPIDGGGRVTGVCIGGAGLEGRGILVRGATRLYGQ